MSTRDFTLCIHQLRQGLTALLVVKAPAFSEAHLASRSHKQSHPQAFLEAGYRTTDGCRCNPGQIGRGREAAGIGRQAKQLNTAQLNIIEVTGLGAAISYMRYLFKCYEPHFSSFKAGLECLHHQGIRLESAEKYHEFS